jgi:hypothetical protein
MARFRGTVQGGRGAASKLGHATTGLTTTTNGWDIGVKVIARVADDKDTFDVYLTGGSNAGAREVFLGTFDEDDLGKKPSQDLDVPELVEGLEASGLNVITIDEDTDFSKLPSLGELLGRKEKQ